MKQKILKLQEGFCVECGKYFEISEMETEHITPWHEGGKHLLTTARCYARKITGGNWGNK